MPQVIHKVIHKSPIPTVSPCGEVWTELSTIHHVPLGVACGVPAYMHAHVTVTFRCTCGCRACRPHDADTILRGNQPADPGIRPQPPHGERAGSRAARQAHTRSRPAVGAGSDRGLADGPHQTAPMGGYRRHHLPSPPVDGAMFIGADRPVQSRTGDAAHGVGRSRRAVRRHSTRPIRTIRTIR